MKENLTRIIEEHGGIGLIRLYGYWALASVIVLIAVTYVFYQVHLYLVVVGEWYFFLGLIIAFFFSSVFSITNFLVTLLELRGSKAKETMKYTRYLQTRLRKIVPSSNITGAESYQSLSAKKLNLQAYQSFAIADEFDHYALFIRLSNKADLQYRDDMLREIASYFARLTNTRFLDVVHVDIEENIIVYSWVKEYAVIRLVK